MTWEKIKTWAWNHRKKLITAAIAAAAAAGASAQWLGVFQAIQKALGW